MKTGLFLLIVWLFIGASFLLRVNDYFQEENYLKEVEFSNFQLDNDRDNYYLCVKRGEIPDGCYLYGELSSFPDGISLEYKTTFNSLYSTLEAERIVETAKARL